MGFENIEELRKEFPVTKNLIYLNHASISPLCRPAARAMRDFAEDAMLYGSLHYPAWLEAYERVRRAAAAIINAEASEIALVKNTSEGIATVAMGIPWKDGDKIVAFKEEFPANLLPWKRLESKGVKVEWLSIHDTLDRIDEAARGARLLSISFIQYVSGLRADLNAIGEICRRRNVFYFVDAIQGMGAFPLDVKAAHIDALAADGHKWMMGPEGCAVLYVRRERLDEIEPVEFGWTNVAGYNDYSSDEMTLRPDAGRYECGTLNTIGCFGLAASLEFILEVGIHRITPRILALGDQIAAGIVDRGYEAMVHRTDATASGIVSFRKSNMDSDAVVAALQSNGIIAAQRHGWVRTSPHFYNESEQIQSLIEALP
jgi:selenocysteine lyase/cysteine desulfurase